MLFRSKKQLPAKRSRGSSNLFFGVMVGAGAGLIAAILLNRRASKKGRESSLTPSEGMQLGLLVFGLLKAISSLDDNK